MNTDQQISIECYPDNEMQLLIMNNFDTYSRERTGQVGTRKNAVLKRGATQIKDTEQGVTNGGS